MGLVFPQNSDVFYGREGKEINIYINKAESDNLKKNLKCCYKNT